MNAEVRNQLAREVLLATLSSSSLGEKASESSIKGGGDDVFAASAMIVASIKSGEYSRALKSVLCFAFQPISLNNNNRGEEVLEDKEFALFLAGVCTRERTRADRRYIWKKKKKKKKKGLRI
jgi:hypothetical protein